MAIQLFGAELKVNTASTGKNTHRFLPADFQPEDL